MGIYISHCNARWSYIRFMHFREMVSHCVGIDLILMEGFEENRNMRFYNVNEHKPGMPWHNFIMQNGVENITDIPSDLDPIQLFLRCSDCQGILHWQVCNSIADRLETLLNNWVESEDKQKGLEVVRGLRVAYIEQEDMIFR